MPNYNTLWEARDRLGMPGGGGGGGGGGGEGGAMRGSGGGVWSPSENHTLYG